MDNQVLHECALIESSPQFHYTPEELLLLNPKTCIATYELFRKIPKKIVTCCDIDQCNYHQLFSAKSKVSTGEVKATKITSEKRNVNNRNKKADTDEQTLPDEIIIAELSDVSESERSAEHSQHCCIHKNNVKISFDDLVRYKTRKTQPPYLAHENAVVNPKRVINREHLENIISSKSSEQSIIPNNNKHTNPPQDNSNRIAPTQLDDTPFSRIVKKIKEKGLVPKPAPVPVHTHVEECCPVHPKFSSDSNNNALPLNQSALTDNFHTALSMFPSVLRRKIMAMSEATSTSSDAVTTSLTSSISQSGYDPAHAATVAASMVINQSQPQPQTATPIQGKTVVPAGTLEKILNSKFNNPPVLAQPAQCNTCTCHLQQRHAQSFSTHNPYHQNVDDIIDLRQLERLQLHNESQPSYYNNYTNTQAQNQNRLFSTSGAASITSTTANKENERSNKEDNLNFKNLVKQALTKPESVVVVAKDGDDDNASSAAQCNNAKEQ